jgi:hypothetical protein
LDLAFSAFIWPGSISAISLASFTH